MQAWRISYVGNSFPEEILRSSIQEDVDVIGVSSLCGAHMILGKALLDLAMKENLKERVAFVIGGVFPPKDSIQLKAIGFDAVSHRMPQ